MSKLIVLGLVLLIGLAPVGNGQASAQVTPSAARPAQLGEAVSLPEGASDGWWATAQVDIDRFEYRVTWQDRTYLPDLPAAYQAPNRAQNLRTYFTPEGIRIIPRTGDGTAWEWSLTLTGYGYEGAIQPVAPATLSVDGNRIEYRRGDLTEWYVNDEQGLEQGFTVTAPPVRTPHGDGTGGLVLGLALAGDLTPSLTEDGRGIDLTTEGGVRVLRYGGLYVEDAAGHRLPAQFAMRSYGISVLVDDSRAIYPIVVDPLVTSPNWMAEGDQAWAFFGQSVGTAGDVNGDGYSDVIVGAPRYDNGETDEGQAFVYHGSATGLSASPDWTAGSGQSDARFGYSVGTAGDVNGDGYSDVVVGAVLYDNGESDEGRAFVYHGSSTGLTTGSADWTAESDQVNAKFGGSVGTAGDVNGDGYSDVIVGAHLYDSGESDEGRAFAYHGSSTGLTTGSADWMAESDQVNTLFGYSVGTAGDVNGDGYSDVIVGAYLFDSGEIDEGRAFVYRGSSTGLTTGSAYWTAESDQAGAGFGWSVGTAGDVNGDGYSDVIVGAPWYDNGESNEGRAFVYRGSSTGLTTGSAYWTAESDQVNALFGGSVGTAGDVNSDDYSDVIVGAFWYDNGEADEGGAFVYHGSSTGLTTGSADWRAEGDQALAEFGVSVGTAGDVNGDGYSDVIAGARWYDNGYTDEGRAFVYHGSPPSAAPIPSVTQWGLIALAGVLAALVLRRLQWIGVRLRQFGRTPG